MPIPPVTPEQRAAALDRAVRGPEVRAEIRRGLKHGTLSMSDVLSRAATDRLVGTMQVSGLLALLPGVGEAGAAYIMEQLGISQARRVVVGQDRAVAWRGVVRPAAPLAGGCRSARGGLAGRLLRRPGRQGPPVAGRAQPGGRRAGDYRHSGHRAPA